MNKTNYIPTEEDVIWAENLISCLKDGGTWGSAFAVFKLDKEKKQLTLIGINLFMPEEKTKDLLHKTEQTFKAVGYNVINMSSINA